MRTGKEEQTMNEPDNPPETALPGSQPKPGSRSWLWRVARFLLLGLATLITLLVLYHVVENWRGKRAWTNYKATMEAQGAILEVEQLALPPVPDDQNFAMTPLLKPLLEQYPSETFDDEGNLLLWKDPEGKARAEAVRLEDPDLVQPTDYYGDMEDADAEEVVEVPVQPNWRLGERFDLTAWQRYYATSTNFPSPAQRGDAAKDVLMALSRFDAELAELKRASERPHSRFNIRYEEEDPFAILLSHLSSLRQIARVVQLRAVAALEDGDVDAAFEDVRLLFAMTDSIKEEPILISHLVRIAMLQITTATIWEGLEDHRWTPSQLEHFQGWFENVNLVRESRKSLEAERAFGATMVERVADRPSLILALGSVGGSEGIADFGMRLVPRGWWYLEGVNYCRTFDDYLLAAVPGDAADLDVQLVKEKDEELQQLLSDTRVIKTFLGHRLFMRILLPALGSAVQRSVEGQSLADLATVAIALERYRLANGNYPDALSELTPGFLASPPEDLVTHEPLRYELTADGPYRLWSVGWNQVDDGGVVLYEIRGGRRNDVRDQDDWVWPAVDGMKLRER
jgi:hypothetical protein